MKVPPNKAINPTVQQRRFACCSPAGYRRRSTALDKHGRVHSRRARIGKVASPPAECLADARLTAVLPLIALSAITGDQGTS